MELMKPAPHIATLPVAMRIRRFGCLSVLIAACSLLFPEPAIADNYTVTEEKTSSPAPSKGTTGVYTNDEGAFFLAGTSGAATYTFQGKGHWSHLTLVRAASLKGPDFIDQGFIYKDANDPFFIYFSSLPFSHQGKAQHRIYYSYDGTGFSRWLTDSGTMRYDADPDAINDFRRLSDNSSQGGPQPNDPPSDGKQTVFPITESASVDGGTADVTVYPEGIIKIQIRGRHSGFSGRTRYSCIVVLSGIKDGEEHVVLNRLDTETLTVGADQLTQAAKKDKVFTQENAFSPADRKNIRNIRVLLEKDRAGDNFVDAVKGMIESASQIFDEAEALYKKIKESDIGRDVATAEASGG